MSITILLDFANSFRHLLRSHEIDIQTIRISILLSCQGHSVEITNKLISIGRLYWLFKRRQLRTYRIFYIHMINITVVKEKTIKHVLLKYCFLKHRQAFIMYNVRQHITVSCYEEGLKKLKYNVFFL